MWIAYVIKFIEYTYYIAFDPPYDDWVFGLCFTANILVWESMVFIIYFFVFEMDSTLAYLQASD